MQDLEPYRKILMEKGYTIINHYIDKPDEFFASHTHPGEQLSFILSGSMEINMDGKHYTVQAGDQFVFPVNLVHDAKIGSTGCEYIVGEMPS